MTFPIETSIYSWISHDFPTIFPWFSHGPATPGLWSSAESWLKDSAAAGWKHSPWKAKKFVEDLGKPGENPGKSAKMWGKPAETLEGWTGSIFPGQNGGFFGKEKVDWPTETQIWATKTGIYRTEIRIQQKGNAINHPQLDKKTQ